MVNGRGHFGIWDDMIFEKKLSFLEKNRTLDPGQKKTGN